jgi:ABC-type tungstate transport system permease subunit
MAKRYMDFMTGAEGQRIIDNFKVNDQTLFFTSTPPAE